MTDTSQHIFIFLHISSVLVLLSPSISFATQPYDNTNNILSAMSLKYIFSQYVFQRGLGVLIECTDRDFFGFFVELMVQTPIHNRHSRNIFVVATLAA